MDSIPNLPVEVLVKAFFFVFLLVYSIVTFVIYYHWRNYATERKMITYTISSYFFTTIPLTIALGVLAYTLF